jgi:hypothetical protein
MELIRKFRDFGDRATILMPFSTLEVWKVGNLAISCQSPPTDSICTNEALSLQLAIALDAPLIALNNRGNFRQSILGAASRIVVIREH